MIILKSTHNKQVGDLVDKYAKQINELESKLDISTQNLINKTTEYQKEQENYISIINKLEEELRIVRGRVGGLTKQLNKLEKVKEENKKIKKLLSLAEKEITEYVKPTTQETRYSTLRIEKSKLVDSERKAKKEKLKKVAKTIHERQAYEKRLENALKTDLKTKKDKNNKIIVLEEN